MKYHHASDHKILEPDEAACQAASTGSTYGLFACINNLSPLYGKHAYTFSLSAEASVLEMSEDTYINIRNSPDYRSGAFNLARQCGIDALRREHHAEDVSLIVLNFDVIQEWQSVPHTKHQVGQQDHKT